MNKVDISEGKATNIECTLDFLLKMCRKRLCQAAFVGKCGNGPDGLYIISYDCIISAEQPRNSWKNELTPVEIAYFVNLEIKAVPIELKDENGRLKSKLGSAECPVCGTGISVN